MTSDKARALLRELPDSNPTLFAELLRGRFTAMNDDIEADPIEEDLDNATDDSDIPLHVVADIILGEDSNAACGFAVSVDTGVVKRSSIAEDDTVNEAKDVVDAPEPVLAMPECSSRGRRIKPSRWYSGKMWERS